jgi:hypothetical protein
VIEPPVEGSWTLKVEATFEGAPTDRLVLVGAEGALRDVVAVEGGALAPLARAGDAFVAPACRTRCVVRYTLDLADLASRCRRMDCERRIGDAILGRASMFTLLPQPMGDATLRLTAAGPGAGRFVTGLRRDPSGGYVFRAGEIGEASFTAFGNVREHPVDLPGAHLDVALLGPTLAMGDVATVGFVQKSAACVASLYGRFPVDATLFVVPVPGASDVVFGRVMSLAGASVALLFGDATPAASVGDNWVVVHELFHLSTPSFVGEGRWLEEGLATYYEPILRARAGWMTEADLWTHFAREMPRGLRQDGDPPSLEDRDDIDSTYWGGALFALVADVRTRMATRNARSLDDAMRAVLAREGDATHAARVADFLRVGDEATGTGEISRAYQLWAVGGANPDLAALWRDLGVGVGVVIDGGRADSGPVSLRDDAPLAAVRHAIAASAPH